MKLIEDIFAHAEETYPQECCGLIVMDEVKKYLPLKNVSETATEDFEFDKIEYINNTLKYEIVSIVHSHPDGETTPSEHDIKACNFLNIQYMIVSWPGKDILILKPGILNA